MAFTNTKSKEVHCKLLYFGASGAGKLTSLRSIYKLTSLSYSSNTIDSDDRQPRWFSFLPVSLTHINDFHIKLHLYCANWSKIPKDSHFALLQGIDGIVFVIDSRIESLAANVEALSYLKSLLLSIDKNIYDIPIVLQYNKRDLPDIVDTLTLTRQFNIFNCPEYESVAIRSQGTMEALKGLARIILSKLAF